MLSSVGVVQAVKRGFQDTFDLFSCSIAAHEYLPMTGARPRRSM